MKLRLRRLLEGLLLTLRLIFYGLLASGMIFVEHEFGIRRTVRQEQERDFIGFFPLHRVSRVLPQDQGLSY